MFSVLVSFCLFMFSLGVVIRFEISKSVFSPLSTIDESQEVVYVIGSLAGIVVLAVLATWLYSLAMLISIVPGVFGIYLGEHIYFGWDRLRQQREDEKFSDMLDPML